MEHFFDTPTPWIATVSATPKFETYGAYFEAAVPHIAGLGLPAATSPCVVVARVTSRVAQGRRFPAGPKDRAKGLMDALHDDRRKGPKYRELGVRAPLPDDDPRYVTGLAVEVVGGTTERVEYRLGSALQISGDLLWDPIDVDVAAPNDIDESHRLVEPRRAFAEAVSRAVAGTSQRSTPPPESCIVIRHRPQRDEDNTWATWIGGLTGKPKWSRPHWPAASPFSGLAPMAIASVAEPELPCEVRYEVYG